MNTFRAFLLLVALLFAPAALAEWKVGESYAATVPFCTQKKDAEELARLYVNEGPEAAEALLRVKFSESACGAGSVRFSVTKLISVFRKDKAVIYVIQIEDVVGVGTYYMLNSNPVVRPKPNA